jgi:sterol desaturase/sphingolipid hydroxylase (fatty acid hydroxylase superfamily)
VIAPALIWGAVAAALMLFEAGLSWKLGRPLYGLRDTEVSLGLALGWAAGSFASTFLTAGLVAFGYAHRVADFGAGPGGPMLALLAADGLYYAWHRVSHHVGWLWATHLAHHTAPRLNILASVRQGWTDLFSGTWAFWAPLGLLGFDPGQVGTYFIVLLIWEACTHNEWTPRLGPLEWLLVTPSNHRVHHSLEPAHWNRNYGGVLIIWDRLFGTYTAEGPKPISRFGLDGVPAEAGVLEIVTRGWRELFAGAVARLRT